MLRLIGSLTGLVLLLDACGGGGGNSGPPPPPVTYTVGGTVTGLAGSGLVLQNNAGGDLAVSASVFTFATGLSTSSTYAVTVKTQPSAPAQNCIVTNGSGTVGTANVTTVAVACSTEANYTVGGTVTGLTGSGLVLEFHDSALSGPHPVALAVSTSGGFTFSPAVPQGSFYTVYVGTEPGSPTQNCVITNGTGVVGTANVDISITCAGVGRFAYTANAGDNTISVYSIDATSGALSPVGTPVPTGSSPYAIVGSPDSHHVYVVNETTNNISAYAVDATSGTLTEIAGSPYAAGTDPQALAFDRTGSYLYVANNGDNNLSAYAVNAHTGGLTPLPAPTYATGTGPTAVSVDGAGKFVFVANNGGSNSISVFSINAATGGLTQVAGSPFAASDNPASSPRSLVFVDSPGLYGLYVTTVDPANGPGVAEFTVDQVTGALTFVTTWIVSVDNYLATDRNGEFLYGATAGAVDGYQILSGGDLFALTAFPFATGTNAYSVTVDPSNQFLYVANEGAGNISGFKLNHRSLSLTPITGSPFPAGHKPKFIATF
jgi:6-phosphogluconolactonase